ncbi:MAG: sugar transferase [Sediminibacterium sp.]|nr:sugar transferase [Sediminibacterium sp.]
MSSTALEKPINLLLKRTMDIMVSIFVILLILSWLLPILAIFIKLSSKGPVFFIQQRSGRNNIPFPCVKLRSMYTNVLAHKQQAVDNDPRVTPAGKFIRHYSLDELPQFFNVLAGHMSVVGPRPHMLFHTESYSQQVDTYMSRLNVKPGITGLSQVMGYRGEIKNRAMIANRVRLDLFYIKKWSPCLDLALILKTGRLLVFGDNSKSTQK